MNVFYGALFLTKTKKKKKFTSPIIFYVRINIINLTIEFTWYKIFFFVIIIILMGLGNVYEGIIFKRDNCVFFFDFNKEF